MFMPGLRIPQGMCLHGVVITCIAIIILGITAGDAHTHSD